MDAERFGKALGMGVRATAAALKTAAEAAAAPNPNPSAAQPNVTAGIAGRKVARGVMHGRETAAGLKRGSKRFGQSVWQPAARAGGVLWYEVTGVFFALFALTAAVEVWHRRLDFAGSTQSRHKVWVAVVMLVIFGWFTVSSFLRARKRARR